MDSEVPPLWKHQIDAIERIKDGNPLAIFAEIGTGKSRIICEALTWHISQGRRRALIFAPPVVLNNWKRELLKFSDIPEYWIHVLYGTGKKRDQLLADLQMKLSKDGDYPYIIITNYEAVGMHLVFAKLMCMPIDILVCDESHYLKSHEAKRTRYVTQISTNAKYRYILTGTPVLNTPMDLFSQYKILYGHFPQLRVDGEISRIKRVDNFYHFRNHYFYDKNAGMPSHLHFPNWITRPMAMSDLNEIIQKTAVCVKKSECLSLPPFLNVTREVEMGPSQQKAYDEMFRDFITYINDDACVAQLAITKGLKLMQIVSGFLQVNEEKIHTFTSNPRLEMLEELLTSLTPEHKVIVWCAFRADYTAIIGVCKKHAIEFAFLTGDINSRQKFEMVDKFNRVTNCRVMIANQQAGGIGINLTSSDTSIYYSRTFSLGGDIQSEGRNYRGGSEIHKCITRIDLITKGTIDEIVLDALSAKESVGDNLLRKIKDAYK